MKAVDDGNLLALKEKQDAFDCLAPLGYGVEVCVYLGLAGVQWLSKIYSVAKIVRA